MSLISNKREYVLISGYYGFDNLGDEAILEEVVAEVERLIGDRSKIVVLSQNPEKTSAVFGVSSIDRWSMKAVAQYLKRARLFISGGGGLFQDVTSIKSVIYYGTLAFCANLMQAPYVIYAQGIGPLKNKFAIFWTMAAMARAREITVRDSDSVKLLVDNWGIENVKLTADPVWCLEPGTLPAPVEALLKPDADRVLIGLSIRESHNLAKSMVEAWAQALANDAQANHVLVPLVLQQNQDSALLEAFSSIWKAKGLKTIDIDFSLLERPSQWVSLLSKLDLVVGMRFHALLMALKSGVPTVGLAYDPKVAYLMKNFEQPSLNLTKGMDETSAASELSKLVNSALGNVSNLSKKALQVTASQKELACQNFEMIARILGSTRPQ